MITVIEAIDGVKKPHRNKEIIVEFTKKERKKERERKKVRK